eukprot:4209914-Prymnesium_polylepis.2
MGRLSVSGSAATAAHASNMDETGTLCDEISALSAGEAMVLRMPAGPAYGCADGATALLHTCTAYGRSSRVLRATVVCGLWTVPAAACATSVMCRRTRPNFRTTC